MSIYPVPTFSLVMATFGRVVEVERFLQTLGQQSYQSFELIVIDQNLDDRLIPILNTYRESFPIIHLRSERGLSRARNLGLRHIQGKIVGFPDDDCWYPPDLLERVMRFFEENPSFDGITGRSVDGEGNPSATKWDTNPGSVDFFNVWKRGISFSIFFRIKVIKKVGDFDETLGVGAGTPWGAGEETDYLLRALKEGYIIRYDPSLVVYHPQPIKRYDVQAIERARTYSAGIGRVLRKHRYPLWFVVYQLLRSVGGALLSLASGQLGKARYYTAVLHGKFSGWIAKS